MRRDSQSTKHSANSLPTARKGRSAAALLSIGYIVCAASVIWVCSANAVGLGSLDIRSYLGEPLNLRIGVITQPNEEIESGCFTVINSPGTEPSISRRDVRLTLVEAKNGRYIEVRGNNSFNEPIGRLSIRAGCQSESGVVRDYALLLDPAPLLTPVTTTISTREPIAPPLPSTSVRIPGSANPQTSGESGRWTVYPGDTLSSLAAGIYPKNRVRQAQYIAALRSFNPTLAGVAVNAPLPLNNQLILPDLKALSASRPDTSSMQATGLNNSAPTNTSASTRRRNRNRTGDARSGTEKNAAVIANTAPDGLPLAEGRRSAKASSDKPVASQNAKGKDAPTKKSTPASGFKLRISGSEMDLSRSQGVSDETRAQLRERFALLDADDQTAQLLALKNNVKQIEKRLNELQLKLAASSPSMQATTTTVPLASPAPPTAAKTESTEILPVPVVPPTTPAVADKPVVDPTVAAKATAPVPPIAPQTMPSKIAPANDSSSSDSWPTWAIAGLSVLALAALAWWAVQSLRRRGEVAATNGQILRTSQEPVDDFNTWINDLETTSPTNPLLDPVIVKTAGARDFRDRQNATKQSRDNQNRQAGDHVTYADASSDAARGASGLSGVDSVKPRNRFAADGAARVAEGVNALTALEASALTESFAADSLKNAQQARADSRSGPVSESLVSPAPSDDIFSLSDPVPATPVPPVTKVSAGQKAALQNSGSFELDIDLNNLASFPSNSGDQTSEDRMRRLRYMQERYPELAARTVSIDESESIIDAARLYYEENQLGKACELLIYSVEERPQEIRYWLAQFELFRLEKMSRQFGELADKFQLLFANTDAWPKIRDIGHELDPGNPLFATSHHSATGTSATSRDKFDPAAENWLNAHASSDASVQPISQALVADLRASLFSEYRVTHADFQGVPDLLNAADARA